MSELHIQMNIETDSDLSSGRETKDENREEIDNAFVLKLHAGDKIDVYDEEMGWWEVATLKSNVHPGTKEIQFTFDENFDINDDDDESSDDDCDHQQQPQQQQQQKDQNESQYLWQIGVEEIEIAPFATHTLSRVGLDMLSGFYVNNDEIDTFFDNENDENIILGFKAMSNNDEEPYLLSDIPPTHKMIYNIESGKYFEYFGDISVLLADLPQHWFNAHNLKNRFAQQTKVFPFRFGADADADESHESHETYHQCADINKVYISKRNELHVLTHDLCEENSYHIRCDLTRMKVELLSGFDENNKLLHDGKLVYVSVTNKLMYFGGKDSVYDCGDAACTDIWYFDLSLTNPKWKLYELSLPLCDNNEFNVIVAGELICLFYYNSRQIYVYDLVSNKMYKSLREYPRPYQGKSVAVKTSANNIHFINAVKLTNNLYVNRPYHFKINLNHIIPKQIQQAYNERKSDGGRNIQFVFIHFIIGLICFKPKSVGYFGLYFYIKYADIVGSFVFFIAVYC